MPNTVVIADTSVLTNFLVLDKVALLTSLRERRFVITEHVRGEVKQHYGQQLERLEDALLGNQLEEIRITELEEVRLFARLTAAGLGIGECSAIAAAEHRGLTIAIDDKRAVKKMRRLKVHPPVLSTEDLVVALIREGTVTVAEADEMKREWEQSHRFRLTFESFSERL